VQPLHQRGVGGVHAQTHDVHRDTGKRDGNFGAREVGQTHRPGGFHGACLAANFVVVGQGPQVHAVGFGALRQRLGRERAVGHDGVAVEIGVEYVGHTVIVGLTNLWHRKHA